MKILFIDPPFQRFMGFYRFYYPLGLATMSSVLHQKGHIVKIFDAEHSPNTDTLSWGKASALCDTYNEALENDSHPVWCEIINYVKLFRPRLIGLSILSVKVDSALRIAQICKDIDSSMIVVAGADHPTVFPSVILQNRNIDIVVRGEGESTIFDLVQTLEKNETKKSLQHIDGISYKHNGRIIHNPNRPLISDLDKIPWPRLDSLVQIQTYRPVDFGAIMASRGCPYDCTFCGVHNIWSRKVRYRSIQNVINEISLLKEKYEVKYFSFRDASFTLNKDRSILFCNELIRRELNIKWECLTRIDLLDRNLLEKMKKAGCVTIRVGIESGDETILRSMRKFIDLEKVKEMARLLNRMGFYWSTYFMFGTPLETRESIQRTINFIKAIDPPFITLSRFAPIPGSEIYHNLEKKGLVSPYIDWSLENNQRIESHYLLNMKSTEFEREMENIINYVEEHNHKKSLEFGIRDARLL